LAQLVTLYCHKCPLITEYGVRHLAQLRTLYSDDRPGISSWIIQRINIKKI
jgi:hypothetical protein